MLETSTGPTGTPRQRFNGFPTWPLDRVVEALRTAGRYGTTFHRDAFASYLGHGTSNSGPFKAKLAAVRDFGLASTRGDIVLTELGKRIAVPLDAAQELADLREAFLSSDAFREVYEASAKGVDLQLDRLGALAQHRGGISPSQKDAFAESFSASASFAALAERVGPSTLRLLALSEAPRVAEQTRQAEGTAHPIVATQPSNDASVGTRFGIRQRVAGGEVTLNIQLATALPARAFGGVQTVVEAIEALAEILGPEVDEVMAQGTDETVSADITKSFELSPNGGESDV
jgi:hypothetical protein